MNKDSVKPYFQEYEKAAHEMFNAPKKPDEEKLLFVVSGTSYGIQIRLAEVVGVREDSELPALYIIKTKKDAMTEKWRYTPEAGTSVEDLTQEKVRGFINDFKNGTVERVYKSQRVPDPETHPKEIRRIVG